jgi:hypothetical protein
MFMTEMDEEILSELKDGSHKIYLEIPERQLASAKWYQIGRKKALKRGIRALNKLHGTGAYVPYVLAKKLEFKKPSLLDKILGNR